MDRYKGTYNSRYRDSYGHRNRAYTWVDVEQCVGAIKETEIEADSRDRYKGGYKYRDFTSKTRVYNSPLYRGLRLWDSLPENIHKETDKASFKKRIATHPLYFCIGGL